MKQTENAFFITLCAHDSIHFPDVDVIVFTLYTIQKVFKASAVEPVIIQRHCLRRLAAGFIFDLTFQIEVDDTGNMMMADVPID